jgi:hypothetical protein
MAEYTNWHEHDRDILRLSYAFPEVLFILWGKGEDLWKRYYLGGRRQEAPVQIKYPSFDPEELVDPDAAAG